MPNKLWYVAIISSLLAASCISIALLKDLGPSVSFAWHPILMSLAFVVFMTNGLNQYWGGKLLGEERGSSRKKHAMLQMTAAVFAIGGWVAIFIAHNGKGKNHTGAGASAVKKIHVWLGYFVLLLVSFQSFVGVSKYVSFPKKSMKFHGDLGTPIWMLGCFNVFLGLCFWSSPSYANKEGTSNGVQIICLIALFTTVSMTLLLRTLSKSEEDVGVKSGEYEQISAAEAGHYN